MRAWQRYFETMNEVVQKAYDTQGDNIMRAAEVLADATEKDGIIHLFGSGHSSLVTEDCFWRSATLANVHAIFESAVAGINEITKTSYLEKVEGIGQVIVSYNEVRPPDVMVCFSNSGNNIAPVDAAIRAREKGIPVVAITAVEYSDFLTTKHRSGLKLKDVADVVLDNCSLVGDAATEVEGFPMKVGATSTIPAVFLQNAILVEMVEVLVRRGFEPDVYYNGHMAFMDEGCADHNDRLVDKYFYRIRNL